MFIENRVVTLQTPLGRNILSGNVYDNFKRSGKGHGGKVGSFSATVGEGYPGGGSGSRGAHDSDKTPRRCSFCSKAHPTYKCYQFKNLTVAERSEKASQAGMCFRCLEKDHMCAECPCGNKYRKLGCHRSHHYLLCDCVIVTPDPNVNNSNPSSSSETNVKLPVDNSNATVIAGSAKVGLPGARLKVLPVRIYGEGGIFLTVYAMIDDGSERTLISEEICQKLGIDGPPKDIVMSTSSGDCVPMSVKNVDFFVSDRVGSEQYGVIDAYSVKKLPDIGDEYPFI